MSRDQQAAVGVPRPFSELREAGLLWLINRQVLHPRGWALALHFDDVTGQATGWSLQGDGIEPWNFVDGTENDYLAAVTRTLEPLEQTPTDEGTVWCETCQHNHIKEIPSITFLCHQGGWGQWSDGQAHEHRAATGHSTYRVGHLIKDRTPAQAPRYE